MAVLIGSMLDLGLNISIWIVLALEQLVYVEQLSWLFLSPKRRLLCGLKQVHRAWFTKLSSFLLHLAFHEFQVDYSLFTYHNGNTQTYLLVYPVNIIVTGTSSIARTFHYLWIYFLVDSYIFNVVISVYKTSNHATFEIQEYNISLYICSISFRYFDYFLETIKSLLVWISHVFTYNFDDMSLMYNVRNILQNWNFETYDDIIPYSHVLYGAEHGWFYIHCTERRGKVTE